MELGAAQVVLGFARGDFHARGLADERSAVEALLIEVLGRVVRLEIVELTDEQSGRIPSMAESFDRAEAQAHAQRLALGREHPAVRLAARLLGADVEEVRDLGGAVS